MLSAIEIKTLPTIAVTIPMIVDHCRRLVSGGSVIILADSGLETTD